MENAVQPQTSGKKLPRPNGAILINTSPSTDFFKWWCLFHRPLVNLTDREIDVLASFLKMRWELSKSILDPGILDTMTMSEDTKRKVREDCNISLQHLYVVISSLRRNKVIVNNVINPQLIPNIRQEDDGTFQLLILFKDNNKKP